ncbi:hypothetical protein [Priestia koreensis]|uniref:Uncharacterized protein n=1 Tax=Priestia koreensis TaxID=284581 RepID=A0A0M0KVH1_9BACI|nr:hypothetical protein [Priestia koreensis]KOO42816.1 hypothetical protein AMD01_16870 [Priestia koreensis]UNL86642.1 hypothetical protein IE339_09195 [Priestia koreensis]
MKEGLKVAGAIEQLLQTQLEKMVYEMRYDFLHEKNDEGEMLCQIVTRDDSGDILATPLSFQLDINEDAGKGEVIFYHSSGEFHRERVDIAQTETILNVIRFVQNRLRLNE